MLPNFLKDNHMRKTLVIVLILMLSSICCKAQININIRYSAPDGGAIKYMNEMISSGLADEIRSIPGCLKYDYFIPQDAPDEVLLMDSWEDQAALNRYHSSEVMKKAEALREKYKIQRNAQMSGAPRQQMTRPQAKIQPDSTMIVRISEIEVYPQYLEQYLEFAHNVGITSVRQEPGVICIYPMQQIKDKCQIRILEIYASEAAYKSHIETEHFKTYKQGTLHMVKSLELVDMIPIAPEQPINSNKQ